MGSGHRIFQFVYETFCLFYVEFANSLQFLLVLSQM